MRNDAIVAEQENDNDGQPAKKVKGVSSKKTAPKKAPVSGALVGVSSGGDRYLHLEFEGGGHITLSPTSNREANRDIVVKALLSLLKA